MKGTKPSSDEGATNPTMKGQSDVAMGAHIKRKLSLVGSFEMAPRRFSMYANALGRELAMAALRHSIFATARPMKKDIGTPIANDTARSANARGAGKKQPIATAHAVIAPGSGAGKCSTIDTRRK
jgi:hypothetical protein